MTLTLKGEHLEHAARLNLVVKDRAAPRKRDRQRPDRQRARARREPTTKHEAPLTEVSEALAEKLRQWRLAEAREMKVPAFCILSNKTLRAIAAECPTSIDDLEMVAGIGPAKAAKFGEAIRRICAGVESVE